MLVSNPPGNYRFLPGIDPYSCGVVADVGYEIVHAVLARLVPLRQGFDLIERHLAAAKRPKAALCGVELRSPAPFTRQGFIDFNRGYIELLKSWDLHVGDYNPLARTNVAPQYAPPETPSLLGFSYTMPAPPERNGSFVVAGGGDFRPGSLLEAEVVRSGETSPDAMREKAEHVIEIMSTRLDGLGRAWLDATAVSIYTEQPIGDFIGEALLARLGTAAMHGLRWYHSRPPIDVLAFEMDLRGVWREELLGG